MAELNTLCESLSRTPFFGGLTDEAMARVVGMLRERAYEAGEVVFDEGDTGASMFVIQEGSILLTKAGESGMQVRLVRLHPGDFFGETTLIEMQPRPTRARAVVPSVLYELTARSLYQLFRENVKAYVLVLQNINRELCRRLRRADSRVCEVADERHDEHTQITTLPVIPKR